MGSGLYICSEEGVIIGCAGDYALMQIAPAADGGSSDSSGNMRLWVAWHSITIGVRGKTYWCQGQKVLVFR